jgi:hypothetical protein
MIGVLAFRPHVCRSFRELGAAPGAAALGATRRPTRPPHSGRPHPMGDGRPPLPAAHGLRLSQFFRPLVVKMDPPAVRKGGGWRIPLEGEGGSLDT